MLISSEVGDELPVKEELFFKRSKSVMLISSEVGGELPGKEHQDHNLYPQTMSSPTFISTDPSYTSMSTEDTFNRQFNSSIQGATAAAIISSIVGAIALVAIVYAIIRCLRKTGDAIQIKQNVDGNGLVISTPSAFPHQDHNLDPQTMNSQPLFAPGTSDTSRPAGDAIKQVNSSFQWVTTAAIIFSIVAIALVAIVNAIIRCLRETGYAIQMKNNADGQSIVISIPSAFPVIPDSQVEMATMERFLNDMAREKPIRFSPQQLVNFTRNYATRLGSGLGIWNSGSSDHSTETAGTALDSSYKDSTPIMRKYEIEIANSVQKL
ncbi:hypothetical protein MRB53_013295 [Persea americana]|uniref:Uncharacterized protein n=1 Tax=Persea americana TaxID=3435 RepID=A0ACC2K7L4_PERAE|nr:hypothetical protein MRB53_013295 [Persea americana]